jgi:tetratricopeptide (TPR) repeat protein
VARLVRFEAVKLMQEKRWAEAKPLFEQALACEPKDVESLRGLGLIALRTDKDPKGAIARFEQALAVAPDSAEELTNLGAAYLEAKRLEDAARVLGRAVDRAPRDPNALFNRAQALTALKRRDEAIRAWQDYLAVAAALPEQAGPAAFARRNLERLESGEPDAAPK